MNHIYRVVFNRSLGIYQCVSELAKSGGKSSGRSATRNNRAAVLFTACSSVTLGMTAMSAQATTYSSGTTTNIPNYTIDNSTDIIENSGTEVTSTDVIVGDTNAGTGNLTIQNAGALNAANSTTIGSQAGSVGDLTVTGTNSTFTTYYLFIGDAGKGSATIADGGSISAGTTIIGSQAGSEGDLTVTGTGSTFTTTNYLAIGDAGKGSATVADGGSISADAVTVGSQAGGEGGLTVTGAVSTFTTNDLAIGGAGKGSVTIADGGSISADTVAVGWQASGEGDLTVTGTGSTFTTTNYLFIGDEGKGSATVTDGGSIISSRTTYVGWQASGVGDLTVTGTGSNLTTNNSDLFIGDAGKGSATVANGGSISAGTTYIGSQASGEGDLTVTGTGSNLTTNGNLVIGFDGKGSATVADGGFINAATVEVGLQASGEGALTVTGANSNLTTPNDLVIGYFGNGTLTIKNLGKVTAPNVTRETTSTLSTLNFDNGSLTLSAAQPALFSNFTNADTIDLKGGGGTIDTNGFAVNIASGAVIKGVGRFTKQGAGTLTMDTASKAWTGGTRIDQGTLAINGNFTLNEALTIGVTSSTDYGKLDVTGIADISAGTLVVDASAAVTALTGSTPLSNIVTATTLTGEFVSISSNSPLITLQADYTSPNAVGLNLVKTVAPPVVVPPTLPVFVPPAPPSPVVVPPTPTPPVINSSFVRSVSQFNPNNLGIAYALDAAIDDRVNNGNNALADALISSTINFNESQLAIAANDLQPLLTGATNRIITDANYMASNAITDHSSIGDRGLWAQIIGNQSNQDSENGISGYDTDSYGAISGLDFPINSDLNLGVSVSYIDSATDNRRDEMSAKSIQVLGYGNHALTDATRLSFHAGVGRSDVEGDRQLSVLSKAIANSDYKVDTLQAGLGISHRIGSLQRNVSPFAQVNYAQAKSDSYRESGAGVYNLDVNDNTYESMRWTAGLKMAQALTPQITLTGQVAAVIENGDRYSDTSASFANNPDTFTTIGQEVGREMGIAGIGIRYMPTPFTALSAGYNGKWGDNYADQGASVALKMMF